MNEDVLIAQEPDVSKIEETDKNQRDLSGDFWKCAEIGKREGVIYRNEFKVALGEGKEEWDIEVEILEEQVGVCREVGNRELEEAQLDNDIE